MNSYDFPTNSNEFHRNSYDLDENSVRQAATPFYPASGYEFPGLDLEIVKAGGRGGCPWSAEGLSAILGSFKWSL